MMTKRHLHEFRQILSYLDQEIGGINQPLLAIALLITLVDLSFQVVLPIVSLALEHIADIRASDS